MFLMYPYIQALGLKKLTAVIGCGGHRQSGHRDMHACFLGER
jgi:hypothetical protein